MENTVIGRKEEIERLRACIDSGRSELIILYGRRRVGKTFLVQQVCDGRFDFYLTGVYKKNKKHQLQNFANALAVYSGQNQSVPTDWSEAFGQLRTYIERLGRRAVVFIDELPWMDTSKSDLVSALEAFWNGWGASCGCLKLILCGSATSWIVNKIFQNKGGLFNRDTCRVFLRPFTLAETEQFCRSRMIQFSRYDVALCYMILGGIPYYLDKLRGDLSLAQNIDNLFFRDGALLAGEFDFLYSSLFTRPDNYVRVVELLSERRHGYSLSQIADKLQIPVGGNLSRMMKDLESCDIVTTIALTGGKHRETAYQLCDFYTLFHIRYIKGNLTGDDSFWQTRQNQPAVVAWRGLAFELLCLMHLRQLRKSLGIEGVAIEVSTFLRQGRDEEKGAQIDLVIERADKVAMLCEMKFASDEFEITKSYAESLLSKQAAYQQCSKARRTVQQVMVTTYGLKANRHSGMVHRCLCLDDLF